MFKISYEKYTKVLRDSNTYLPFALRNTQPGTIHLNKIYFNTAVPWTAFGIFDFQQRFDQDITVFPVVRKLFLQSIYRMFDPNFW